MSWPTVFSCEGGAGAAAPSADSIGLPDGQIFATTNAEWNGFAAGANLG
jgi:hypothetical protein